MSKNDYETKFSLEQVKGYVNSVNWNKRLTNEIPFLTDLFKKYNYENILDLGCGPGKHAIELAKMNFNVTGIDIDEKMIEFATLLAQEQKRKEVSFRTENIFDNPNDLESKFDALFTLGNALMIIWTSFEVDKHSKRILETFKSLNFVLKKGGGLFFQILNSDNPRDGHVISKITELEGGKRQMLVKHFIPITSENKLYTTFSTLQWEGNSQPEIFSSRKGFLYLLPIERLQHILEEAGFSDFEFFENYKGSQFNKEKSDSLLLFCRKK